jgi:N-acetylglutamate synthase-like GNAT family acetyltransferase
MLNLAAPAIILVQKFQDGYIQKSMAELAIRHATVADIKAISQLIKLSARQLGAVFYDSKTIETALTGAFGVDTQLIDDQTYYVISNSNNELIACGGWSYRKTLFGSDSNNIRNSSKLDPANEAAKIRAFFIHPEHARKGLGKQLLNICEQQAKKHGFSQTQLMSTLSGIDFYKKNGYRGEKYIFHPMNTTETIKFLPMTKQL